AGPPPPPSRRRRSSRRRRAFVPSSCTFYLTSHQEHRVHPLRSDHMPALGEEFRSAREARGLTLSDVAEQIHIRSVYLGAIENEEWKAIGAPVYVRGFIRNYARFLALDAKDALARSTAPAPAARPAASMAAVSLEERERPGLSLWAVIGGLVALA